MLKGFLPRVPLLVLLGALCLSTNGLTQVLAPEGATPYVIGGLRMLGGGLALFIWCWWRGLLPKRSNWPLKNVLIAALGLMSCQITYFKGVELTGLAVGTVVALGFTPIAAAILGRLFLGEKPSRAWYPATGLAVLGLLLLHWGDTTGLNPFYLLVSLSMGVCYGLYMVFGKELVRQHPPETVMMCLCLLAGIGMLPFFFIYPTAWLLSPGGLAVALNLGVVTTALALSLTLAGLKSTPAATASTLSLAEPLNAALIGILLLHEPITMLSLSGLGLIFAGVFYLILRSRPHA